MTSEAMTFMTANGVTGADQKVDLIFDEIKDTISPFVLEESPSILSIGKRCADNGCGFLRMPGEKPIMFDDRQSVIRLRVKDHIPYFVTNDETGTDRWKESPLGILDFPENHAEASSGGLTSLPDETPIAAPAEEPGEEEQGVPMNGTKVEVVTKMKLRLMLRLEGVTLQSWTQATVSS